MLKTHSRPPKQVARRSFHFADGIQECPATVQAYLNTQMLHDAPSSHYHLLAGRESFE